MQEITESTVTIFKSEYDELLENSLKYEMLLENLYSNARKSNWNKNEISFNDDKLCDLLKLIDKFDYKKIYKSIIETKEEPNE